jgi:ABC-type multidrug transport system ATPase subunit
MLKMVKLSKMYPKRWWKRGEQSKNALDSVTMGAEKGSVFVLLGHNGAGKSSLINILTGMNSASAGDVLINQKSVTNELGDIRKTMGVCQQDDILFPELTGEQHLWLLGMIRGLPRSEIKKTIEERLRQVKLYKVRLLYHH